MQTLPELITGPAEQEAGPVPDFDELYERLALEMEMGAVAEALKDKP